jgi:hypothetical protein
MFKIEHLIILLLIVIVFYTSCENREHYTTVWTPFSKVSQNLDNTQCTSQSGALSGEIGPNNRHISKNFGNFGIIGKFPAIPLCNSCGLEFNCVNYPYTDADDKNMNVCRKCDPHSLSKNYNQIDKPLFVSARSAGRPRQCRQIN